MGTYFGMSEKTLTLITTSVTNLASIPTILYTINNKLYYEMVLAIMSTVTSIMYHSLEVLGYKGNNRLFGMNEGQWHRLDNVFIILGFQALIYHLFLPKNDHNLKNNDEREKMEFVRWVFLSFTLLCQERAPWDVTMTFVPILVPLFYALYKFWKYPEMRNEFEMKNVWFGFSSIAIAVFFFIRGLDDENDWIRLNHGLWHMFVGIAYYFFINCVKKRTIKLM